MRRRIRVSIETTWAACKAVEYIDMPDDASDEEIEEAAADAFSGYCSYGWSDADPEEDEDNES